MLFLTISEKILLQICGIGILQGVLLALLLYFHPKSDRSVNKFLALYIFFVSLVMTLPLTMQLIPWQKSTFQQPLTLLTGPLLYLYLRSFKETITLRKALPHFLSFLVFIIPIHLNISAWGSKYPTAKDVPAEVLHSPATLIINYLKFGQSIVYYILAHRTLVTYQRSIKQLFSDTSRIDLRWAKILVNGFMVVILSGIVLFSLMIRFPEHFNLLLLIIMAITTPYIYLATYKAITQPNIWQLQPEIKKLSVEAGMHEVEIIEEFVKRNELSDSPRPILNDSKLGEFVEKVIYFMEEEKLYQEPELTLNQLATTLKLPAYQVSQAINEGMGMNFYDLINGYRVEEAKQLLMDPKNRNYTILSVGFEAGFNSKTTFNTVFKKYTGLTPTNYREQQQLALVPA